MRTILVIGIGAGNPDYLTVQAINAIRHVLGYPIPAVLITGDTSPDQVKRVHDSGHRVLFKPVLPKELSSMLRQLS